MEKEEMLIELKKALHNHENQDEIIAFFDNHHPYDIANVFDELNQQERQEIYDTLPEEKLADIFEYIDEEKAAEYIKEMSYSQGADVLNEMESDDAVDILKEISSDEPELTNEYLAQMDDENRDVVEKLNKYDEDTAGAIMTTNFIKIKSGIDVKEATKVLGYMANDAEVVDPLFVCEGDKLVGVLKLQDLILARTPKKVDDVMDTNFVFGTVNEDTISISNKINNYDIYALPILDNEKMVGIVTMDDAIDVASDAIKEDMSMMAAVSTEASKEENVFKNVFKRIPWLIALLLISLAISNITSAYEDIISKVTVLWFFNTMILDMAGNCGTQTLAVAVRHLGRKDLKTGKDIFLYLGKELLVVILNALVLGVLSFGVCFLFIKVLHFDHSVNVLVTSLVISSSLSITLVITGILGGIIPIIMDKIHVDPAIASGPLITTLNDVLALLVYFGLAQAFMSQIIK